MRARRRQIVDEYADDGRVAIYADSGVVVVLSDLASAAWACLGDSWVDAPSVAETLVQQFGAPPGDEDAVSATEHALSVLAEHELVDLDQDQPASG